MSDDPSVPEPGIPLCPKCGKPMKLEDCGGGLSKHLGLAYGEDDPARYEIVCCGLVLRIEDDADWREAIRLLKLYHGTSRTG